MRFMLNMFLERKQKKHTRSTLNHLSILKKLRKNAVKICLGKINKQFICLACLENDLVMLVDVI